MKKSRREIVKELDAALRLVVRGARRRLTHARRSESQEQVEHEVLFSIVVAAGITAIAFGWSRFEFAAWLRTTAGKFERGVPTHRPPTALM